MLNNVKVKNESAYAQQKCWFAENNQLNGNRDFDSKLFNEELDQNLINYFSNTPTLTRDNFNDVFNGFNKLISQSVDLHAPLK